MSNTVNVNKFASKMFTNSYYFFTYLRKTLCPYMCLIYGTGLLNDDIIEEVQILAKYYCFSVHCEMSVDLDISETIRSKGPDT